MILKLFSIAIVSVILAGCVSVTTSENLPTDSRRHLQPIPEPALALMKSRGMNARDPILVRIFKLENELEVWKGSADGTYKLFKTYPICRWSGRLGPKKRQGDRQTPEGFYHVTPAMMNPASNYYLSFNLGFPNRLERALGYTGDHLMVHGACSSRGCYAMTDEGIAEIFAIAREAFRGGQRSFQVQAYPFRMTTANMRAYAADANIEFWRNLRDGFEIFEATRRPLAVDACGGRYVFHARSRSGSPLHPTAPCPELVYDLPQSVLDTLARSRAQELVSRSSTSPNSRFVDGDMHPRFRSLLSSLGEGEFSRRTSVQGVPVSRPEALR